MQINTTKDVMQTQNGVDIHIKGEVKKEKFEAIMAECDKSSCECGCNNIKERISDMNISGTDGHVVLSLIGDGLSAEQISKAIKDCDLEARL